MAGKKNDLDWDPNKDDLGLGDDFDFDLGLDPEPPKKDRKPVTSFAKGFAKGVRGKATDISFLKRFAKTVLPPGYSDAIDAIDKVHKAGKDLYHTAVSEVRPSLRNIERATKAAMPVYGSKLPKKLQDRLNKLNAQADARNSYQGYDPTEAAVSSQMTEVFGDSIQQSADQHAETQASNRLRDQVEKDRFQNSITELTAIRSGVGRLVGYQEEVTARYQRKSLELQLRQYLVSKENLEFGRDNARLQAEALQTIVKNTGLPDYVKLNSSEAAMQQLRQRVFGGFANRAGNFSQQFFTNLMTSVQGKVKNSASALANGLSTGSDLVEAAAQARAMGAGGDVAGGAGNIVGSGFAEVLANTLGVRLRGVLGRNEKLAKGGERLAYGIRNAGELTNTWAKNRGASFTPMGRLLDFIAEQMPAAYGNSTQVTNYSPADMYKPRPFDGLAHKSLTEIIPGYLARILTSSERMRTGDSSLQPIEYNLAKGEFGSRKAAAKDIQRQIFKPMEFRNAGDSLNQLVDRIDPEKKLSPEARRTLALELARTMDSNDAFSPERFASGAALSAGTDAAVSGEIGRHFTERFNIGADGRMGNDLGSLTARRELADQFSSMKRWLPNYQDQLNMYANTGQRELLRNLGLIRREGNLDTVNHDAYWDRLRYYIDNPEGDPEDVELLDESATPNGSGGMGGGSRSRRSRSRRRGAGRRAPPPLPPLPPTPPPGPAGGGTGGFNRDYTEDFNRLITTVSDTNTRPLIEAQNQELTTITDLLHVIIAQQLAGGGGGTGGSEAGGGAGDGSGGAGGSGDGAGRRGWLRRGLGASGRGLRGFSRLAWRANAASARLGFGGLRLGFRGLTGAVGGLAGLVKGRIEDVYTPGSATPRLVGYRIRAGEYFDQATGRVIRSINDIKGPVVDGSGQVVLAAEDFAQGLYDAVGRRLTGRNLMRLITAPLGALGRASGLVSSATIAPFRMAGRMAQGVLNFARRPKDVYVTGEPTPRLLATLLQAGAYRLASTGRAIHKLSDITGDVMDADGNMVLTHADMVRGLVDRKGRPFQGLTGRLIGLAGKALGLPVALAVGLAKASWAGAKLGGRALAGVGSLFGLGGGDREVGGRSGGTLMKIYRLLDQRLAKRPGMGVDEDGLRVGSWQERFARLRRTPRPTTEPHREDQPRESRGLMGLVGSLVGIVGGAFAKIKSLNILGGLANFLKLGWLGTLAKIVTGGRAASAAADAAGDVAGGRRGGRLARGARAVGRGAVTAASVAGKTAGRAVGGLGRLALGAGRMVLPALLPFLTNPVTLGLAAVAVVGYGAYKLYQHYASSPGLLQKLRFAQYGIDGRDDKENAAVIGLEEALAKSVKFTDDGYAYFGDEPDVSQALAAFGVDPENPERVEQFGKWFAGRFKPVYLTHKALARRYLPKADFQKLDDSEDGQAIIDIATHSRFSATDNEQPYDVTVTPFDAGGLISGDDARKRVEALIQEIIKKYKRKATQNPSSSNQLVGDVDRVLAKHVPSAVAKATGVNRQEVGPNGQYIETTKPGGDISLTANKDLLLPGIGRGGELDDFTALMMRAYGLSVLNVEKATVLMQLERAVINQITFDSTGVAAFTSSTDQVFNAFASQFGLAPSSESDKGPWMQWFQQRFLPITLAFATVVRKYNRTEPAYSAVVRLKPEQRLEVAKAVMGAHGSPDGVNSINVWQVGLSGWPNTPGNTDPKSVSANMESLMAAVKNATYVERNKPAANDATGGAAGANTPSGFSSINNPYGKWMPSSGNPNVPAPATKIISATGQYGQWTTGYGSHSNDDMSGSGTTVADYTSGSGGLVDQLPKPKGDGSYEAYKDLLNAAAQMTGVDPRLMATMAKIESGFRAGVKAGTSSATGLYQFISDTWKTMLRKYGAKYGIPMGTPPTDARANALMGAEFLKENQAGLKQVLNRPVTDTDLYAAHFLGLGGARTLLRAMNQNPSAVAAQMMPQAAQANRNIFYDGTRARSVAEVYQYLNNLVQGKGKQFKGGTGAPAANDPSMTPATAQSPGTDPGTAALATADTSSSTGTTAVPVPNMSAPSTPTAVANNAPPSTVTAPAATAVPTTVKEEDVAANQAAMDAAQRQAQAAVRQQQNADNLDSSTNILSQQLKTQVMMSSQLNDLIKAVTTLKVAGPANTDAVPSSSDSAPGKPNTPAAPTATQPMDAVVPMKRNRYDR